MSKHTPGPLTDGNCGICGGSQGIHQFETFKCPLHGKEARIGEKQVWLESTFINVDYKRLQDAAPDLLEACKEALEFFVQWDIQQKVISGISLKLNEAITKSEAL